MSIVVFCKPLGCSRGPFVSFIACRSGGSKSHISKIHSYMPDEPKHVNHYTNHLGTLYRRIRFCHFGQSRYSTLHVALQSMIHSCRRHRHRHHRHCWDVVLQWACERPPDPWLVGIAVAGATTHYHPTAFPAKNPRKSASYGPGPPKRGHWQGYYYRHGPNQTKNASYIECQ